MSIKGKNYPFYLLFIPLLIILTIPLLLNLTGVLDSDASGSVNVLTEMDFADDPGLSALPEDEIVAVFLEAPSSVDDPNDTGEIGLDVIPYKYEKSIEQTFCWDDDNPASEHFMTLYNSTGAPVITVDAGGDCITETIDEGEYEMHVSHDGNSDKRVAVFIVPEGDEALLTTASDETPLNLTSVLNSDKCIGCDLSDVNLSSADLSGVDLTDAMLNNAILVDADLSGANLQGAQLQNADLSRANLKGANLAGADLTSAILINADLSDADLTMANFENADVQGAKLGGLTGALFTGDDEAETEESAARVHDAVVATIECNGGAIAAGTGEDLLVKGACTVGAGTYHYRNVNIIEPGSLTFEDAVIDFWAYGIIVENKASLIAGSEAAPIGTAGGKLTIHLYGEAQPVGGSGVPCKTPTSATVEHCGIPKAIWDTNGASKVCLPPEEGGTPGMCKPEDYFYQYKPLPQDDGDLNAFFGYKVLGVSYGGTLRLFGKKGSTLPDNLMSHDSGMSWARLDGDVDKGATQLKIDRPVDWKTGDRIVVTTTDYLPGHSEVLEIIDPPVDAMTFNFKVINQFTGVDIPGGLQYPHNGTPYPLDSVASKIGSDITVNGQPAAETRAAVGLLTRDIMIVSAGDTFNSDFPPVAGNHFGGHTLVRQGVKEFKVQGVQFHQLGQGGKMGHYPAHFHLTRKVPEGTFIKDSSITDSMTRWITLHGAQGVMLARNVGCMSIGHGFYLEDGTEINNKLYSNLGILARAAVRNVQNPREVPGILAWSGRPNTAFPPYNSDIFNPTVFWIMNGWNDFEYNMAAGASGCGVCYWLLPGANSGPSQGRKWEGYASMQSGQIMMEGDKVFEINAGRMGMTPLKTFKGNYCTSAMMSFNTVGETDDCLGLSSLGTIPNPNGPPPEGDRNKETFYPKVDAGGGRFATNCPGTDETRDCGPSTVVDRCSNGDRSNCMVTILDKYTSSFHWPQQNFAAIWLRPQWYLYINSFLSDTQNGGLGFVTGGDYLLASIVPGLWQLATKSVFVGHTQDNNPFSSNAGPFNPLTSGEGDTMISGLACDNAETNHCRSAAEGISMPLDNFAVNQRLYNIYDGPNYQDSNAYFDITETNLEMDVPDGSKCSPAESAASVINTNCPAFGPGVGMPAWMYTRLPGIPVDKAIDSCVLPNAAIGWKQPNGFFYPPAFHSRNLHFDNVNIRHYVLEPLWEPGTYDTIEEQVRENYCTFPIENMFGNFSSVDRQTVVNDNDGSLTGLLSPIASSMGETISVNLDPFFNAPIEAIECESFETAKTSPYEYVSTVVYPGCVENKDCGGHCKADMNPCARTADCAPIANNECVTDDAFWGRPCTNANCYGVPLERQLLTTDDALDLSTTGIRMAGMDLFQRSMMTLNGATYYVDTTVSEEEQRKSATSINVFKGGETYYVFFLYSKASTNQKYQIYVGKEGFSEDDVSFVRTPLIFPLVFTPEDFGTENKLPPGWDKDYDSGTGILTVTVDMAVFEEKFIETKKDFCQPKSFCDLKDGSCQTVLDEADPWHDEYQHICQTWAGKDVDCPLDGCPGFSFKLPMGFEADNMGNVLQPVGHRPKPICFPEEAPWKADFIRADMGVAGSCETTPIPASKFCTDFFGGGGGMPPPEPPPVGGAPDMDGDGIPDAIDVDMDGDGIPNDLETAPNGVDLLTSSRMIIPADPDGDGIPNELDLDSDGDCIPDHFEAGGTNDANRDGVSDNFVDADADGHHDAHDASQGGVILSLPDTDGDQIPDFLDNDSDNDGMTDTDETGGVGDANNDGVLDDQTDANEDGLADIVPAAGNVCVIQDTDGDGLPDHLDLVPLTPADPPGDGDGGTGGNGACALASSEAGTHGLAGLAVFALIPLAVVFRRKFTAGAKR